MELVYRKQKEAALLGELYFQLRSNGISCSMQVAVPSDVHQSGEFVADLAVFSGDNIAALVEVKKPGCKLSEKSRQARAYRSVISKYKVPVHFVNSYEAIEEITRKFKGNEYHAV